MLRYSLLRLLLFIAVFLTLWLAGAAVPALRSPWVLLLLTAALSAALSWFALRPFREAAAVQLEERVSARTARRRAAQGPTDEELEDAAARRDDFV